MPRLPVPKPLSFLVADKQKDLTELAQALGKLVPTQNGWGCEKIGCSFKTSTRFLLFETLRISDILWPAGCLLIHQ